MKRFILIVFMSGLIFGGCGPRIYRTRVRGNDGSFSSMESSVPNPQSMWERCSGAIQSMQCSSGDDFIYRSICMRSIGNGYFSQRSHRARQEYLIQYGCPPPMVGMR